MVVKIYFLKCRNTNDSFGRFFGDPFWTWFRILYRIEFYIGLSVKKYFLCGSSVVTGSFLFA